MERLPIPERGAPRFPRLSAAPWQAAVQPRVDLLMRDLRALRSQAQRTELAGPTDYGGWQATWYRALDAAHKDSHQIRHALGLPDYAPS